MAGLSSAAWYPGVGYPVIQTLAVAENSDDDQIHAAVKNEFNATTHFLLLPTNGGFLTNPDTTRNVIVTMNNTATGALKLTGTDIMGFTITENLTWAGESGVKASTKAFKTVSRFDGTFSATTVQAKIGTGNLLGLRLTFPATTSVLGSAVGGVLETVAPAMTYSSTVLSLNTIDTSSAPGSAATKVLLMTF